MTKYGLSLKSVCAILKKGDRTTFGAPQRKLTRIERNEHLVKNRHPMDHNIYVFFGQMLQEEMLKRKLVVAQLARELNIVSFKLNVVFIGQYELELQQLLNIARWMDKPLSKVIAECEEKTWKSLFMRR